MDLNVEYSTTTYVYLIKPGNSLAFPMYYGAEVLTIEMDTDGEIPASSFKLSAGGKAQNIPNEQLGAPEEGSYLEKKTTPEGETYYIGGTWSVDPVANEGWQLPIKKFGPDPQSDDVTAGPGTPG